MNRSLLVLIILFNSFITSAQIAKPVIQQKSEPKPKVKVVERVVVKQVEKALKIGKYDTAYEFSDGVAVVCLDNKYGFINKNGDEVLPPVFDYLSRFKNGLAAVRFQNSPKIGFINKGGEVIIPFWYDGTYGFADDGFCVVVKNQRYGFIDKLGNEVIPIKLDGAYKSENGIAPIEEVYFKHSILNINTGMALDVDVNITGKFSEGFAPIQESNTYNYGFIDTQGHNIIPCNYTTVSNFSEGLAYVYLNRTGEVLKQGYINRDNEFIIKWEAGDGYEFAGDFINGLARVQDGNKKWGFIDKSGKVVIPIKYSDAMDFSEGLASVALNGKWKYIDKTGKVVLE